MQYFVLLILLFTLSSGAESNKNDKTKKPAKGETSKLSSKKKPTQKKKTTQKKAASKNNKCEQALVTTVTSEVQLYSPPKRELHTVNDPYSEIVILDAPYSQVQNSTLFGPQSYGSISRHSDERGEAQTIDLHIYGGDNPGNSHELLEIYDQRTKTVKSLLPVGRNLSTPVQWESQKQQISVNPKDYSKDQLLSILKDYFRKLYEGSNSIPEDTVDYLARTLIDDPETVNAALANYNYIMSRRIVTLTNVGEGRYFWYQPINSTDYFPARVLDIHFPTKNVAILIEWMALEQESNKRVRFVSALSPEEASTIIEDGGDYSSQEAMRLFMESLSINEIITQKLALKYKINKFGYTNAWRLNSIGANSCSGLAMDALNQMSCVSHLAIYKFVQDYFPKYRDYLTQEELYIENNPGHGHINIIDVFSRIPAAIFFSEFAKYNSNFEYFWVITEDGQLKISPHMHKGHNLKLQSLRLAHGRKIFAAGSMTLSEDGFVHLKLNSEGYQELDTTWGGSTYSFQTSGNGDLKSFVSAVFALQTNIKVKTINSVEAPKFHFYSYEDDELYSREPYEEVSSTKRKYGPDFSTDDLNDFLNSLFGDITHESTASDKNASNKIEAWNMKSLSPPMKIEEWQKFRNLRFISKTEEILWAHYVLDTDSNLSFSKIKKRYRKLSMQLHPDKMKNIKGDDFTLEDEEFALSATKLVNKAYETLEAVMK
ncbi:MAG: J domain-containing protein [Bdellovibrionales bacterium]|nr:J domain-containing protein [Bdellovibrionales bacterium]